MDWEGIKTAYLDRERARLGLPSRMQIEEMRAKRAQEEAMQASQLETAGLGREKMRAEIAEMPGEADLQRRLREAQIRNYDELPRQPAEQSSLLERIMAMPPEQQAAAIKLHRELNPQREPVPSRGAGVVGDEGVFYPGTNQIVPFPSGFRPKMPVQMKQAAGAAAALQEGLRKMDELAAMEETGQVTTGPIAGRLSRGYKGLIGPSGVEDPEYQFDFLGNQMVDLVYQKSGKQINEEEMQILKNMIPTRAKGNLPEQVRLWKDYANRVLSAYGTSLEAPDVAADGAPVGAPGAIDPEVEKRLKALGY